MLNEVLIRRSNSVLISKGKNSSKNLDYVMSLSKNLESLGYGLTENLINTLLTYNFSELENFYGQIIPLLKKIRGVKVYNPMYPNFPSQVMDASSAELYFNAIVHYWSFGALLPLYEKEERFPLIGNYNIVKLDLADENIVELTAHRILTSNTSLSVQDKDDFNVLVDFIGVENLQLPKSITQKETISWLVSYLATKGAKGIVLSNIALDTYCKTATDLLRVVVGLSGGDVSLAKVTKFVTLSRPQRRMFLSVLNNLPYNSALEDMARYKNRWIRLGEKLHPNEFTQFRSAINLFQALRNSKVQTFASKVEAQVLNSDVKSLIDLLQNRPGDFARRLDQLLCLDKTNGTNVVNAFEKVADKVSTPVLLQVTEHFKNRSGKKNSDRIFFPKGNLAKAYITPNRKSLLHSDYCQYIVDICKNTLEQRFSSLDTLGKVYIDVDLKNYLLPFSQRSASKAMKTIVRGSRIPLGEGDTVRFFCYWVGRDVDLSASLLDSDYQSKGELTYYNLRNFAGCHSGDITSAPNGASEFIDVSLDALKKSNVRYIVMSLYSYSRINYSDMQECFAGWMMRKQAQSGEIYEPKTVQNKFDLTAESVISIPLVIDIVDRVVIWCDMSLKNRATFVNQRNNMRGVQLMIKSLVEIQKPNVYDLVYLHAKARATQLVNSPEEADTVFDCDFATKLDVIASEYML